MTAAAALTPDEAAAAETAALRLELRAMVMENTRHGMDLSRQLHAQAMAEPADADPKNRPDYTIPYARISYAIRQNILLIERLSKPLRPLPAQSSRAARATPDSKPEVDNDTDNDTEPGTEPAAPARPERAERLYDEIHAFRARIKKHGVLKVLFDICRDLGIEPPADNDLAAFAARLAAARLAREAEADEPIDKSRLCEQYVETDPTPHPIENRPKWGHDPP